MKANTWQLQQAKNHFSEVVAQACASGVQTITKHGKPVAVIVAMGDFETLKSLEAKKRRSLLEVLPPLPGSRNLRTHRKSRREADFGRDRIPITSGDALLTRRQRPQRQREAPAQRSLGCMDAATRTRLCDFGPHRWRTRPRRILSSTRKKAGTDPCVDRRLGQHLTVESSLCRAMSANAGERFAANTRRVGDGGHCWTAFSRRRRSCTTLP